jgi:uncharacterized protein YyaL (SSP411 family)
MPNRLADETSPYLLQHADNPVDWMPWGPDALDRARAEGRPVLLSVGYAACHWCHVMAHECFEDEAIAALMNELFVNVKVDREERPDVDAVYQSALALLGQPGGWPLTMFLTPDGEPFWGGTYFPPEARWGRPGFPDVLRGVAEAYRNEPEKVARNTRSLREALERTAENRKGEAIDLGVMDRIAERLLVEVDPVWGGFGRAPKFPQPAILHLLWRAHLRTGRPEFGEAVTRTLAAMCQGGIYDHLGGGFARYSTDAEWLVPHFEKMLYDNAQLVELLTLVWQRTRTPLFRERVEETVGWVLREMVAPDDDGDGDAPGDGERADAPRGFASTLDADSEGGEGRFYVWSTDEVARILGPEDAALFAEAYDVTPLGNWEGTNILNRRLRPERLGPEAEARLARARDRLLQARAARVRPGRDDKVLADWNGLMIAALAEAGMVLDRPDWVAAAARAFAFVRDRMAGPDGRLLHSRRRGRARHRATLDDLACMARAALALFEATADAAYLDRARAWADEADRHHRDLEGGGYFLAADDAERLIVRTKSAADAATPSGNGTMMGVLARLWHLTGEAAYRDAADELAAAFAGEVARNFFPLATLLTGTELLYGAVQVVVVGDPDDPAAQALRRAVLDRSLPDRILTTVAPGAELPPGHPAAGKGTVGGRPAAYVCRGMACAPPAAAPAELAALLG